MIIHVLPLIQLDLNLEEFIWDENSDQFTSQIILNQNEYKKILMKELTPILFFQEILSSKRPHLTEAQQAIQAYLKINFNGGPYRKILMINALTQFISTALSRYITSIEKLKFNVFYSASKAKEQQTTKKRIKTKRQNVRRRKTNKNDPKLTMNEILQIVVCDQLEQQSNSVAPQKVRNLQILEKSNIIDIPPFEQDVILQLTQKVHSDIDSFKKQEDFPQWQPSKLENYKNWLALTQNGIDPPKNKRVQKTKKKTNPSIEVILDRKIDISQGIDQKQVLDQLHTKLKSSKSDFKKLDLRFEQKLEQLTLFIIDSDGFINDIKNKFKKFTRNHNKMSKESFYLRQPSVCFSPSNEKQQNDQINIILGTEKKYANNQLEKYLEKQLTFAKKITLKAIADSNKFSNLALGDIFYNILHSNYLLRQAEPSEFSEILILTQ